MNNDTVNHQREIVSKADAKAQGAAEFFTGIPCKSGHVSPRYVLRGLCVLCVMESNEKRKASGKHLASIKQWQESNPDRLAAAAGWQLARKRKAVLPDDFKTVKSLLMATEGFYREARRLREETGVMYHVDHILPLARGGQHHPGNLRVITSAFNRAKKNMTDIGCLEAVFSGTWKGPRDAEVLTTLVDSVAYEFTSTGASASIQATA